MSGSLRLPTDKAAQNLLGEPWPAGAAPGAHWHDTALGAAHGAAAGSEGCAGHSLPKVLRYSRRAKHCPAFDHAPAVLLEEPVFLCPTLFSRTTRRERTLSSASGNSTRERSRRRLVAAAPSARPVCPSDIALPHRARQPRLGTGCARPRPQQQGGQIVPTTAPASTALAAISGPLEKRRHQATACSAAHVRGELADALGCLLPLRVGVAVGARAYS